MTEEAVHSMSGDAAIAAAVATSSIQPVAAYQVGSKRSNAAAARDKKPVVTSSKLTGYYIFCQEWKDQVGMQATG